MGDLTSTYSVQGRWKEAEELQVQVKDGYFRLHGAEHPDTLMITGNLSNLPGSRTVEGGGGAASPCEGGSP